MSATLDRSLRVLVLAPTDADAEVACQVLATGQIHARACDSIAEVCECVTEGAGALLLTEEALAFQDLSLLADELSGQEPWSDMPLVLLTSSGQDANWGDLLGRLFVASGNLTLIERPCRAATLLSAIQVALRARRKQYDMRELLRREQEARRAASAALERAHESEQAREALLDGERAARTEAEKANRLKDEFLATLSHELRTPLAVIINWSRVLATKFSSLDPQLRQGLSIVTDNAMAQAKLISDLLDLSRIISGKISLETQRTDLTGLISRAVSSHRPGAETKGISLELHCELQSASVQADGTRLQQVFWNLLSNAIKFTPQGGHVSVSVRTGDAGDFEVTVRDTGEGIAEDFLPDLFDRFRQQDGSISRRHGGLGIGLAIAKQIVEMHGGSIRAHSEGVGRGACFTVSLPAAPASTEAEAAAVSAADEPPLPSDVLAGIRVLTVEDQPDMLEVVRRMLEEYGAQVVAVESGSEALKRLGSQPHQTFDVLVSDIGMPKIDGYALLRAIRNDLQIPGHQLPAIAVTAFARPEDRHRLLAAGFQAHLTKPYQVAQLVSIVRNVARHPALPAPKPSAGERAWNPS
jgi:signal transduction histidine kinase/ActR/RegA family two-component response regulator